MSLNEQELRSFYFGGLPDDRRLEIERAMLEDTEVLLDYLDLKRKIEGAAAVPSVPSTALWNRLRPASVPKKVWWISLAVGAALAASLCFFLLRSTGEQTGSTSGTEILFDSGAEQSPASNVL